MSNDDSKQTRRNVLQQSAIAGSVLTLGSVAFTGNAAADKPTIRDVPDDLEIFNPCTDEFAAATEGQEVFDADTRVDSSGGLHVNFKFSGNATFEGNDSGLIYEASINGSQNLYVSADGVPTTETTVFRFKVISRGSASNFLAKLTAHLTVNANGVETVNTEWESEECL